MNLLLKVIHPQPNSDRCRVTIAPCPGGIAFGDAESREQGSDGHGSLVVDLFREGGEQCGQVLVGLADEAYLINENGGTVQRVGFVYKPGRTALSADQPPKQPPKNDPGVA